MMRRLALAVVAALAVGADSAAAIPSGTTLLVDRTSGFGPLPFDGVSWSRSSGGPRALSADGCFAVFESRNDVLFSGDDDSVSNIYRLDRCSPGHPLVLVSTTSTGAPGRGNSYTPSISADGRYVAFSSDADNLHPDISPTGQSTLVKDLQDGSVELASRADGVAGTVPRTASYPVIAGNGRAVTFITFGALHAANADGIDSETDAYVRMLDSGHTYMASVTTTGTPGGVDFNEPAVPNHDGTAVALVTRGALSPADVDGDSDAYLVRGLGGAITVQLASFTAGNTSGAQYASTVALSSDGLHVAYAFRRVWETTCNPTCTQANQPDFPQPESGDFEISSLAFAQTVSGSTPVAPTRVFWSTDRPLLPEDTNTAADVYARRLDYTPGSLTLLSPGIGASATDDAAVNLFDSRSLALPGTDGWNMQSFLRAGSQTTVVGQPEGLPVRRNSAANADISSQHAVSADGRMVAFISESPDLGAPLIDSGPAARGFVRDVVSGVTTPVTVAPDGTPANRSAYLLSIDAAGEQVAFVTSATNLVDDVPAGGNAHVYVRNLRTGVTKLVDRAPAGTPLLEGVATARISADGRAIALTSRSAEIPGGTGGYHAFVLDLATGTYTVVDRTAAGTLGDGSASEVDISANGRRVAFVSDATNLGGGTTGTNRDAYVKDLDTGALTWVSVPQDGTTNHSAAGEVALSANGRIAAFGQHGLGFGYGTPDALWHVFVRDLDAATTTFVSSAMPAGDYQLGVALSADGSRVAFANTGPRYSNRAYVWDLPSGPAREVAPGAAGQLLISTSLSANGDCVAFTSRAGDLVSPSVGPDYQHVLLRAVGDECLAGPPSAPGGPGITAARDTTRPVISKLSLSNKRFALAKGKTAASARTAAAAARRGTTFRFSLSEPAGTVIAIARKSSGRRSGKRCVKPAKRLRGAKRCTRYVTAGTLTRKKTKAGANRVAYSGRIGKRSLTPGAYRAALVATDAAGNRSVQRTVSFTVVRR